MSTLAKAIEASQQNQKFDSVFECPRCNGKGFIPEFRHIKDGTCFLCCGAKKIAFNTKNNAVVQKKTQVVFKRYEAYKTGVGMVTVEAIEVWMNSKIGMQSVGGGYINDENREEYRLMWSYFKANGAEMIVKDETK